MDPVAHGNRNVIKRKLSDPLVKMEFEPENGQKYSVEDQVAMMNEDGDEKNGSPSVETRAPRKKKLKVDVERTPLMLFNETFPENSKAFAVDGEAGPSHDRLFDLSLVFNGVRYEGQGKSKKEAKQKIAEKVLRSVGKWPMVPEDGSAPMDESDAGVCGPPSEAPKKKQSPAEAILQDVADGKNAVMVINENHPDAKFTIVSESGKPHDKVFTSALVLNGKKFEGSGSSKKDANTAAASKALFETYGAQYAVNNADLSQEDLQYVLPQAVADMIGEAVVQKFAELSNTCDMKDVKRKVLAGIVKVVQKGEEVESVEVVSLGTGTKCISGGFISDSGLALNDCHGEVIARRGFCLFLYNQLELYLKGKAKFTCLQKKKNGLFGIKEGVTFHLYVSTSPCGDARIFSPQETCAPESSDKHPQRKTRGLLRTKIENGEGTLPIKPKGVVQTWDGVLLGERLLTMSCSDKIFKWNVVGLQGALLSHYFEPVYLTSVVLGSLYNFHHLTRALYKRLDNLGELAAPYKLNAHLVNGVSIPEQRATGKSPGYSMNWTIGDEKLECVNAAQGKMENNQASHLCKESLHRKFSLLWKKLKRNIAEPSSYQEAKNGAKDYQASLCVLKKAFHESNFGIWVAKPDEHDEF